MTKHYLQRVILIFFVFFIGSCFLHIKDCLRAFFVINLETVSSKTLKEIDDAASKFVRRVKDYWNSSKIARHVSKMPLEGEFFSKFIDIVPERTQFVQVQVPSPPRASGNRKSFEDKGRSAQFAAANSVRSSHEAGAILKASYGAAKSMGQNNLAKLIKESAINPDAAAKAVDGLTYKSNDI